MFQYEKSQLSIASITYPNRFKVLPKYLKSNHIRKVFLYTNQNVNEFNMNFFTEADPELTVDIGNDVSLNPDVLVSNFNKKFLNEQLEWSYDKIKHRMLIKSKKNAYLLQIPIPLGNLLGLQESNVDFVNPMVNSHLFRPSWFYKFFTPIN